MLKYIESRASVKNTYAPVEYMMKNLKRQVGGMINDALKRKNDEQHESFTLHRDGVFLEHVQGDDYYDYFLHYDDLKRRLMYFVAAHKLTQKTEGWTLIWEGEILQRVEYELLIEEQEIIIDSPSAPYEGYGTEIDGFI